MKLIGATCHYVTADLDEGPIIEQEVIRVEHFHSSEDLLRWARLRTPGVSSRSPLARRRPRAAARRADGCVPGLKAWS